MISIKDWSIASFLRQNWSIISRQDSLWIKWCYTFLLKMFLDPKDSCRFFLDLQKTVQISNVARPFVKYIIGTPLFGLIIGFLKGLFLIFFGPRIVAINTKVSALSYNG